MIKPGTYTQMYIHLVFAVKFKDSALDKSIRHRVFEYMSGILSQQRHKPVIINGVFNHVHVLFGLNPSISISDTVHALKRGSSIFINSNRLCKGKFAWQEGYGGFTYSRSQLDDVYKYIQYQEEHHKKKSFKEEYVEFLSRYQIDYDQRFLFNFIETD